MILKTFELNKIKDETIFYLLYGKNDGLKSECIDKILNKSIGKVYNYDEKQIKDEIENELYTLSKAHYEKYFVEPLKRKKSK